MKRFLAIFTGTQENMEKWLQQNAAIRKQKESEGIASWKAWSETNHGRTKYTGGPLGKTKRVDIRGIHDIHNSVAAFTVIEAASHEEAARLFLNHPHFAIFPGDGVEIMEIMPIPQG